MLAQIWFDTGAPNRWVLECGDYWRTPNVMTALAIYSKASKSSAFDWVWAAAKSAFYQYFDPNQSPQDRMMPAYYDDEAWWGVGFMRVYDLTGDQSYLQAAQQVYADLKAGWDDIAGGGIWFERNPKSYPDNFKAAISTELYFDLCARLYACSALNHTPEYLQQAQKTWDFLLKSGLVGTNGLVAGQLNEDGSVHQDGKFYTYTQGVILGGLWGLYAATQDAHYLTYAEQIAQAAIDTMIWQPSNILREMCEVDQTCSPDHSDPALFKGIYMRYLGELAVNLATVSDPVHQSCAKAYAAFIANNANTVWTNYPNHVFGMDWHISGAAPSNAVDQSCDPGVYNATVHNSSLDLFISAALVSTIK